MTLDLHDVLVGIGGLIYQHIPRSSPNGYQIIALLIPGQFAHTGLGDSGALVLADGLAAVKPALVLQSQLEDLDGWIMRKGH